MPLYFAYGVQHGRERDGAPLPALEGAGPGAAPAPSAGRDARGLAERARDPRSTVHGVLWDLALADVAALDRFEGLAQGLYAKIASRSSPSAGRSGRWSISA